MTSSSPTIDKDVKEHTSEDSENYSKADIMDTEIDKPESPVTNGEDVNTESAAISDSVENKDVIDSVSTKPAPPTVFVTSEDNNITQEVFEDHETQLANETQSVEEVQPTEETQLVDENRTREGAEQGEQNDHKEEDVEKKEEDLEYVENSPNGAELAEESALPEFSGPVVDFYRHKSILLTGATGFIGKSVLWKLIHSLGHSLGRVYILIRSGSNKRSKIGRPAERLKNEIFNNKAFVLLRQRMGPALFDSIVKHKIIPVAGDIISPDLSMADADREQIIEHVHLVIHCAAALNFNERLDLALETNTLGTLRIMDLADECKHMEAFIHASLAYTDPSLPNGHIQERVYPMRVGDPEELLTEIVDLELGDIPKMTQRILNYYPNTYTFTKSLTEHLIMKRVDINRVEEAQGGKAQWPIAIIRATQVGAALNEPLPGWVDDVTGANGMVYLMGKGIQVLPPDASYSPADIVPVDMFSRVMISSAAIMEQPGYKFVLPYNEITQDDVNIPTVRYFPYIFQVSAINPTAWRDIYRHVKGYWSRNGHAIPATEDYFGGGRSLFKPSFFIKYKFPQSLSSVLGKTVNRTIENASSRVESMQPFLKHNWIFDTQNVLALGRHIAHDSEFELSKFGNVEWSRYMVNYAFGTHAYISPVPGLRNITLSRGWSCALYDETQHPIMDRPIDSVVFSVSDIEKRTSRMLGELMSSLESPHQKKTHEQWVNDFDASLDDWCHDDSDRLKDTKNMSHLGFWLNRAEGHEEHIRIEVLNDSRVGGCIKQITETSGVPQKTVVGEALKILQRMRERTQLHYIWSAGAFLHTLFQRLFSSLRVREQDLIRLKEECVGKNIVYVPASKTMIDQILVWYVCLRYELPLPAMVCDEALALLGPISDMLRISGAYFVRRDPSTRSPLSTAVAAAYTEVVLSEHGALSMVIERARSRTGRLQTTYHDGIINMVIESTLGHHHVQSTELLPSPNASFSSVKKDTIFVPVNITYEKIPELRTLIDQVLDQKPKLSATASPHPSYEKAKETSGGQYGRAFIAFGDSVNVKNSVQEAQLSKNKRASAIPVKDEDAVADFIAKKIQQGQHEANVISPVALVSAALLFGRTHSGITMGKVHQHITWLHKELQEKKISVDWQPDEDVQSIVAYTLELLDSSDKLTMDSRRLTDQTTVRVVEQADNVMDLSYNASQLIEIFLPEALFSVVYLSNHEKTVSRKDLLAQFTFLVRLFKHEFVYPWNRQEKFSIMLEWFLRKNLLKMNKNGDYEKVVTMENNEVEYTRVCLLASFIYPTLDAYWITSCSLSALRDLPYMPRKVVPVLSQWIAAHLITGRRTVYREVLSTEASQNAVDNFLAIGFIEAVHPKSKLSPDAQILLLELGVTTQEDLVTVSNRKEIESSEDCENILVKLTDIASLCHEIEKYRFVTENASYNAQVFDKCQSQIRSILRAEQSYATQHGMKLEKEEDQMIQLVYSLKTAAMIDDGKESRRVSQAYNLK
ncbi:male sterility protein-domain-containing protein [Sporodiniella umbellata]|nr:male sterility protein-domain-containing protein [Sporodiniella umbellata]